MYKNMFVREYVFFFYFFLTSISIIYGFLANRFPGATVAAAAAAAEPCVNTK